MLPRDVFDATGGWAEPFFYAHEGIELAWRVWDQGRRAWYAGDLVAHHPAIDPTRHAEYYRLNARNRVWLARRNLPAAARPASTSASWTGDPAAALVRATRRRCGAWFGGWREGWRRARRTAPDGLAHGRAHDAGGPAAGHLSRACSGQPIGCGTRRTTPDARRTSVP